jgi:hypothetical protein
LHKTKLLQSPLNFEMRETFPLSWMAADSAMMFHWTSTAIMDAGKPPPSFEFQISRTVPR